MKSVFSQLSSTPDLRETQERLQLIINNIGNIANVNNFRSMSRESQAEMIAKFQELLRTLDHLQPMSAADTPEYDDLKDTCQKLKGVIGTLLDGLQRIANPAAAGGATFAGLWKELSETPVFGAHPLLQDKSVWRTLIAGDSGKLQAGIRDNAATQSVQIQLQVQPSPGGKEVLLRVRLKPPSTKGFTPAHLTEFAAVHKLLEQEIKKMGDGREVTPPKCDPLERMYLVRTPVHGLTTNLKGETPAALTLASILEATTLPCRCPDCALLPDAPHETVLPKLLTGKDPAEPVALSLCPTDVVPLSPGSVLTAGLTRVGVLVTWACVVLLLLPLALLWAWALLRKGHLPVPAVG